MIAAKRKIAPCTRLKLHKDASKVALDDGGSSVSFSGSCASYGPSVLPRCVFLKPCSSEEHKRFMHYVELRPLELLASHGDYLGVKSCRKLGQTLE